MNPTTRLALLVAVTSAAFASSAAAAPQWEQVMKNDKVAVYTRAHAGKSVKEIKATGTVDVPAWILKNVVDDVGGYTKLIPFTAVARVVAKDGNKDVTFQRLEMPFTQAREYVTTNTDTSYTKADGLKVYRTEWTSAAPRFHHHVSKEAIHLTMNDGSWTFEELPCGKTRATFHLFVDPEGELPKVLVNLAQQLTIAQYLDNLARRAQEPQYRVKKPAPSDADTIVIAAARSGAHPPRE